MVQGQIESVVYEEYFLHVKAFFHTLDLGDHLVDGPNHPPTGLVDLGLRGVGRIIEASQLSQDTDAEAGFVVAGHVQVFQAGRLGELRSAETFILDDLSVFLIDQAGQVEIATLAVLHPVGQDGERLAGVAG